MPRCSSSCELAPLLCVCGLLSLLLIAPSARAQQAPTANSASSASSEKNAPSADKPAQSPTTPQASSQPAAQEKEHTVEGILETVTIKSKILHNTRTLRVWLPGNYFAPSNRARKYPVLYMQDGEDLFDDATATAGEWHADETADHLAGSFQIRPMVIVGIDSLPEPERSREYLPYADQGAALAEGKEYAEFVVGEVLPLIERKYHVATTAAGRGIGGAQYGADESLFLALHHPGVFSRVLLESPVLANSDNQLLHDAESAKLLPQKIYLGVGTHEGGDAESSAALVQNARELEKILRSRGMGASRLKLVVEENGVATTGAWSRRLPEALLFLWGE